MRARGAGISRGLDPLLTTVAHKLPIGGLELGGQSSAPSNTMIKMLLLRRLVTRSSLSLGTEIPREELAMGSDRIFPGVMIRR